MKKLMIVLIAILFLLSTTAFCFAQGSKAQPEATPLVGEKDKMTAPLVSKEELQKRKEQQAEQKKARKAKKAEKKKMTKEQKMKKGGISSAADVAAFFQAYNERKYDVLFEKYMAEDCFWHASERALKGKREILDYWINRHSAFEETLGTPENVVFGEDRVYLQTKIRLDFIEDGSFYGRPYKKGDIYIFGCTDYSELDADGKIKYGIVYTKFFDEPKSPSD